MQNMQTNKMEKLQIEKDSQRELEKILKYHNAEFIVQAVNSHHELIEALKELMTGHSLKGQEQAKKALALAGVKV